MIAINPTKKYKIKNTDAMIMLVMYVQLFVNNLTLFIWIIIVHDYIIWVHINNARLFFLQKWDYSSSEKIEESNWFKQEKINFNI